MNPSPTVSTVYTDSKKHFPILDGLRGVAALIVVIFHAFEVFALGDHKALIINHAYLAVDFFFLLSGYVIGYAYDDRWGKMTLKNFFTRRLIRLHPMIIMGMLIGGFCYYFSASPTLFPDIADTPFWHLLLVMFIGFTLLPLPPSMDIRGWIEMHPLNGPAWSLFFEYVANILYALVIRRLSNTGLVVLVFISGAALIHLGVSSPYGDIIGGWSLEPEQLRIGFTRLMFPFTAGLLISRVLKPKSLPNMFLITSILMVFILGMPRIGGSEHLWWNGLYDALAVILAFPLVVYLGASGGKHGKLSNSICLFFGDIAYPLYIIHYPIMYIFMAWVVDNKIQLSEVYPAVVLVVSVSLIIAYGSLKLYDIPLRRWLTKRFLFSGNRS